MAERAEDKDAKKVKNIHVKNSGIGSRMRYPLKGRLSTQTATLPKIEVRQPVVKEQTRSLVGRVQPLPKNGFWHRVGCWLFVEEEERVI